MTAVPDAPRRIISTPSPADRVFRYGTTAVSSFVLVVTGCVGVFLGLRMVPTFQHYGLRFLTSSAFNPEKNLVGIAGAITGSVEIAVIALVISFPVAISIALYITQYAPNIVKSLLVSVLDLMAAIPSVVYGLWGEFFLEPKLLYLCRWLSQWFGWIPIFKVNGGQPSAPAFQTAHLYEQSAFIAGTVVAMMVIPLAASVMRGVFDQTPPGEREAAYALGSTRWGMIRAVVIPFGRGGIIGGMMLGLGRALGETIAVLLILSSTYQVKFHILENGGVTISSLIANVFGASTGVQLSALLAAGFVLFLMTLVINTLATVVISRSRSGAGVDA